MDHDRPNDATVGRLGCESHATAESMASIIWIDEPEELASLVAAHFWELAQPDGRPHTTERKETPMPEKTGWIGVDFDGTLAHYEGWRDDGALGAPVPAMLERVKAWLAEGKEVRIFTARIWPIALFSKDWDPKGPSAVPKSDLLRCEAVRYGMAIQQWCREHLGQPLDVTCQKDYGMVELWDDRAVGVKINTGEPK